VLLTRDAAIERPAGCLHSVFFLADADPAAQLARVRSTFGLIFSSSSLLSRCAACNGVVGTRVTAEQMASGEHPEVPGHVRESGCEVWACNDCAKSFWTGPKSRRAIELAARLCATTVFGHPLNQDGSPPSDLGAQICDVLATALVAADSEKAQTTEPSWASV
jgi:uncharacterized protein with PIN domain